MSIDPTKGGASPDWSGRVNKKSVKKEGSVGEHKVSQNSEEGGPKVRDLVKYFNDNGPFAAQTKGSSPSKSDGMHAHNVSSGSLNRSDSTNSNSSSVSSSYSLLDDAKDSSRRSSISSNSSSWSDLGAAGGAEEGVYEVSHGSSSDPIYENVLGLHGFPKGSEEDMKSKQSRSSSISSTSSLGSTKSEPVRGPRFKNKLARVKRAANRAFGRVGSAGEKAKDTLSGVGRKAKDALSGAGKKAKDALSRKSSTSSSSSWGALGGARGESSRRSSGSNKGSYEFGDNDNGYEEYDVSGGDRGGNSRRRSSGSGGKSSGSYDFSNPDYE